MALEEEVVKLRPPAAHGLPSRVERHDLIDQSHRQCMGQQRERIHGLIIAQRMPSFSPLADAFAAVLRDRSGDTLLLAPSESRTLTATQIDEHARRVASVLAAQHLTRGHLVIACIGNTWAMPSVVLACLRDGLPLMPVDKSTPPAELRALASRWDAAVVLVPDALDLRAPDDGADVALRRDAAVAEGIAAWRPDVVSEPDRHAPAAVLKLTSGSTGEPRATCSEERHLIADVQQIADAMDIGPRTRQLGVIPLSHSYGFSNLLLPLLWQGSPLLLRQQFVPTQVGPDITDGALATFAGVPFMFEHLARHQTLPPLPSLRLVLSAGARLPFETVTAFHAVTGLKVRSFYGSSETGGICFDASDALDSRVPVGQAMGDTHVELVADPDAPEGSGRVRVSGPAVIDRYAGDTGDRIDGAYLTGDYARMDANGTVVLVGRLPSFVNVAGRKVQPQEVEAAIRALPGVRDAVAVGIDDSVRGQALAACVESDHPWDARTLREALAPHLAPHKLPRVVITVQRLPLTDRGKIDRAAVISTLSNTNA